MGRRKGSLNKPKSIKSELKRNGIKITQEEIKKTEKEENKLQDDYINLMKTLTKYNDLTDENKRNMEIAKMENDYKTYLNNIDEETLYRMYCELDVIPSEQQELALNEILIRNKKELFDTVKALEDGITPLSRPEDSMKTIEDELIQKIKMEEEEEIRIKGEKLKTYAEAGYDEHPTLKEKYYKIMKPERIASIFVRCQSRIPIIMFQEDYTESEKQDLLEGWSILVEVYLMDLELFLKNFPLIMFGLIQLEVNVALAERITKKRKEKKGKEENETKKPDKREIKQKGG